jgi:GT2 family glycosyltransferase
VRISVIVITFQRPDYVHRCLEHLAAQIEPADEIVVVDASNDSLTAEVVSGFAEVEYLLNPAGAFNMTTSRNVGLRISTGDIIAFLDDDAFAEPSYVQQVKRAYDDPTVALACSRTLNGQAGEASHAPGGVGTMTHEGELIGNFAFDAGPGQILDIDHGVGATMSFRRSTLDSLGGFREDYSGVSGVREDSDVFLRAKRLGHRAVFINDAVALHVGAPQAKGQRFDLRYEYWSARNHALLLINNFGLGDPRIYRSQRRQMTWILTDRKRSWAKRAVRAAVSVAGFLRGIGIGLVRQRGRALPAQMTVSALTSTTTDNTGADPGSSASARH